MEVKLLSITPQAEELIETCGRICYQSEPKEGYKVGTMIKSLIKNQHFSVLEHGVATFLISGISRACSHQVVRSRLASFSQASQRYCNQDQFDYVVPPDVYTLAEKNPTIMRPYVEDYHNDMKIIQGMYNKWKKAGLKNEDARFVISNSCTTELAMTANFREWRHFIETRSDTHAQWEIRNLSNNLLQQLHSRCPNVFDDLYDRYLIKNTPIDNILYK